ncbi:unnamed protein product, partial [Ectocarpus sp. 12 AP-2014]
MNFNGFQSMGDVGGLLALEGSGNTKRKPVQLARALELQANALSGRDVKSITVAALSRNTYTLPAANIIAAVLKELPDLIKIDFSDIIDTSQQNTGTAVFKALCEGVYDKKISLFDMGENTLTPESVEDCRPIVESDHMRDLLLVNSDLSGPSMIQLT